MWSNWAGNQTSNADIRQPDGVDTLRQVVSQAETLRVVGSGHSFTPLIRDSAQILRLDVLHAPIVRQVDDQSAWVNANATLRDLSPALSDRGLAFRNLGDINAQTLAGAMSTATHGTGAQLPCLSAELTAARFMTAQGEVLDTTTSENTDLLPALQVSLGLLGVVLEAQITLVPKYNLHRQTRMRPPGETLENMGQLWATNRNFEFFYIPFARQTVQILHNETDRPIGKAPTDLDNLGVRILRAARNMGRVHPMMRRALLGVLTAAQSDEDYVGESWKVLCSQRDIPFVEMEYHLPENVAADVLKEVLQRTETRHPDIYFPIEVRKTAADTAYLSPFQGAPRISVAIHSSARDDHRAYFDDIEPIFRAAKGRPHWGKLHSLTQAELDPLYPDFDKFSEIRRTLDPTGKFLTPTLANMFGGDA